MSKLVVLIVGVFLCLLPVASNAQEASLSSMFQSANNEFWNGDYEKALKEYKQLVNLGVEDAALFYNLGTAYARLGKLGTAVLYYEKALRIDPSQNDARHNIAIIREFIAHRAGEQGREADLTPAVGPWRAVIDRFSSDGAAMLFLGFHLALFIILALRRFAAAEMFRLSLGVVAGVLAILTATTLAIAIGKWKLDHVEQEAVVVAEGSADIMEGPGSEVKRFALEEGSRVNVLETRENWLRIKDSEGRDGWSPSSNLGTI